MDSTTLIEAYQQARESSSAAASEDRYRDQWRWDKTARATHCVDCYPGNCPMQVYIRDGEVVARGAGGDFPVIERGVPDANPMGCQKGACWSQTLNGEDRIRRPLRRVGERGEARWEEISWDDALTELADAMLDAIQDKGPESIVGVQGAEAATWGIVGSGRLLNTLGGHRHRRECRDQRLQPGIYLTLGKFNVCSSLDDWFHSELILIFPVQPHLHRQRLATLHPGVPLQRGRVRDVRARTAAPPPSTPTATCRCVPAPMPPGRWRCAR